MATMKSIEEKAKAYDEALKKAKDMLSYREVRREDMEYLFPELKESEDERIINHIKKAVKEYWSDESLDEILAWLEKQGKNNMGISEATKQELEDSLHKALEKETPESYNEFLDEQGEQKSDDVEEVNFFDDFRKTDSEVGPKFHEGDWITNGDYTWKIVEVKPLDYILQSQDGNIIDDTISYVDEQFHSFTIQDAKPGDVLVNQNGEMPFIFKECKNNHIYCYCGYTNRKDIFFDRFVDSEGEELHWLNLYHEQVYPATKEQRDLLFSKMKEAGYEWDAEHKQLKKIESKPAWSEEDEEIHRKCICAMRASACGFPEEEKFVEQVDNWLKSLKDRVQPQPKREWSEEDETTRKTLINLVEMYYGGCIDKTEKNRLLNFIKSLRPQKQDVMSEDEFRHIVGYLVQDIVANEHMAETEKQPTKFFVEKYYKKLREE